MCVRVCRICDPEQLKAPNEKNPNKPTHPGLIKKSSGWWRSGDLQVCWDSQREEWMWTHTFGCYVKLNFKIKQNEIKVHLENIKRYFYGNWSENGKFVEAIMKQTKMKTTIKPGLSLFLCLYGLISLTDHFAAESHIQTHKPLKLLFLRPV